MASRCQKSFSPTRARSTSCRFRALPLRRRAVVLLFEDGPVTLPGRRRRVDSVERYVLVDGVPVGVECDVADDRVVVVARIDSPRAFMPRRTAARMVLTAPSGLSAPASQSGRRRMSGPMSVRAVEAGPASAWDAFCSRNVTNRAGIGDLGPISAVRRPVGSPGLTSPWRVASGEWRVASAERGAAAEGGRPGPTLIASSVVCRARGPAERRPPGDPLPIRAKGRGPNRRSRPGSDRVRR
jgi:hypothetical protein